MILLPICLLLSLFGYIGFNLLVCTLRLKPIYWYLVEIPIQFAVFTLLMRHNTLNGLCFGLLHLSFVNGWLFYVWAYILNIEGWKDRKVAEYYFLYAPKLLSAKWTISGVFDLPQRKYILLQAYLAILTVIFIQFLAY